MKITDILSTKYNIVLWIIFVAFVLINALWSLITSVLVFNDGVFGFICVFVYLFLPFALLLWNFQITKMTERKDIFVFGLFLFCSFLSIYQFYPNVALFIMMTIILYNYLSCTEKEYSNADIAIIVLTSLSLYKSFGAVIFTAPLLYLTAVRTFGKTKSGVGRIVKFISAIIIICAGIYNLWLWFISPEKLNLLIGFADTENLIKIFLLLVFLIIFAVVFTKDYLKETFSKEFLTNIITVSLIIGIIQNILLINKISLFG